MTNQKNKSNDNNPLAELVRPTVTSSLTKRRDLKDHARLITFIP